MHDEKKYLTGRDIRRIYSISRSTLIRWHKLGMPRMQIGYGLIRYDPAAVEKWAEKLSNKAWGVSDER